ncbi:MAG: hypothetical protein M3220_09770 [Chloroflexota bacterium]|nr:hypothetical protein [Chloroflexota bacterium]
MTVIQHETRSWPHTRQRGRVRHAAESRTRPNMVSLVIALGVIGLVVWTVLLQWDNPLLWWLLGGTGLIGLGSFIFGLISPIAFETTVDYPIFYPSRACGQRMLIVRMSLSRGAKVDIDIYDELNRHVITLVADRKHEAGKHFRLWDGRNAVGKILPAGSYLIQVVARTTTSSATRAVWVRLDPSDVAPRSSAKSWIREQYH